MWRLGVSDQLLRHHIEETREKFQEIKEDLGEIRDKLECISAFKIEVATTSRNVSLIVSAFCGLITLLATVFVAIKTK